MNPVAVGFGAAIYSGKKLLIIVLLSMFVILALPMVAVGSMGTSALSFLASSPNAKAAESKGFYMGEMVPGNTYEWGNCTYWATAGTRRANGSRSRQYRPHLAWHTHASTASRCFAPKLGAGAFELSAQQLHRIRAYSRNVFEHHARPP